MPAAMLLDGPCAGDRIVPPEGATRVRVPHYGKTKRICLYTSNGHGDFLFARYEDDEQQLRKQG